MENNQRFFIFLALSMAVFFGWAILGPKWFPGLFPKKPQQQADAEKTAAEKTGKTKSAAKQVAKKSPAQDERPAFAKLPKDTAVPEVAAPKVAAQPKPKAKRHPAQTVVLGSDDPASGYFLRVQLSSRGAAVAWIELNDDRYKTIKDPNQALKVVGNTSDKLRTFQTSIPLFDDALKGASLNRVHWATGKTVVEDGVPKSVTFEYALPDGSLKVRKRYWLEKVELDSVSLREAQNTIARGYELRMELTIENQSAAAQDVEYTLQGAVGLPLENVDNARVFRGMAVGLIDEDGDVKASELTAKKLAEEKSERWDQPLRYVGIDTQYFAALVVPADDKSSLSTVKSAEASVVEAAAKPEHSDITFQLKAKEFNLPAGESVSHRYALYAGPKRKELLAAYDGEDVIKFGFFGFFAKIMLAVMNVFHDYAGIPWGIAIICLTIVVRGAMFPLSKKQAKSGRLMKELQPKIAELKKKYGNDREKMAKAQMELFSKHGYNPFAGCLPILLQLPIFIGLYTALSTSIDLRLAAFPLTWIDNLAAPDALFQLPFSLPFLGSNFNLLPIITCVLFIVQQKMFMPPPAPDDEQAQMTHKMMTFMPIIMGFLFYRVPSGLCVYFIASSVWGIGERKLLDMQSEPETTGSAEDAGEAKTASGKNETKPDDDQAGGGGLFGRLLAMADQAADTRAKGNGDSRSDGSKASPAARNRGGKKKGGRKGKRSRR